MQLTSMVSTSYIIQEIEKMLSFERQQKIRTAVKNRTYSIIGVLDQIYDQGNIHAIMRTAELLGICTLYIVQSKKLKPSYRTTKGAHKWLHLKTFSSPEKCIRQLQDEQIFIFTTGMEAASATLNDFTPPFPCAVVFGNEKEGVSKAFKDAAQGNVKIPSFGLTQSFNLSVAFSLVMYHLRFQPNIPLISTIEQEQLLAHYYYKSHGKFLRQREQST